MKKILLQIFPALFLLVCLSVHGQNRSTTAVPINITLVKGINLSTIKGDLNFGEIVTNSVASKMIKNPNDGVLIEVNGNPGRDVFVNYSNTILTVDEDLGTENTSLNFQPKLVASVDQEYIAPTTIESSSSVTLNNKDGFGKHYLWIGGEIEVNENSQHGNYQGTLTLTVSY
jgi:spore coat protein U-like protein